MAFTITTDVFCDDCGNWDAGESGNTIMKTRAWARVKKRGWSRERGKHICPVCNGKATGKGEYGYYYVETPGVRDE